MTDTQFWQAYHEGSIVQIAALPNDDHYYDDGSVECNVTVLVDLLEPEDGPAVIVRITEADTDDTEHFTFTVSEVEKLHYIFEAALAALELNHDGDLSVEQKDRAVRAIGKATQACLNDDTTGVATALLSMGDVILHSLNTG